MIAVLKDDATKEAWIKKKLAELTAVGGDSSSGLDPSTPADPTDTSPPSPTSPPSEADTTASNPDPNHGGE